MKNIPDTEKIHKHILRDNALSGYSEKAKNELRQCLNKAKEGVCQPQK